MSEITRKVWALESGFSTENASRDEFFMQNPIFLVQHSKKSQHLIFTPLAFEDAKNHDREDQMRSMTLWETTTAKLVEESEDKSYKCYETASGIRYHLYLQVN